MAARTCRMELRMTKDEYDVLKEKAVQDGADFVYPGGYVHRQRFRRGQPGQQEKHQPKRKPSAHMIAPSIHGSVR